MRYLEKGQRSKIGYDYIVEKLQLNSPYGRRRLHELKPYERGQERELSAEHLRIEESIAFIGDRRSASKMEGLLMRLRDIAETCESCRKGRILDEVELYEIKVQGMVMEEIRELLSSSALSEVVLSPVNQVVDLLDPSHDGMPTFHIYSSYSPHLEEIRRVKRELEENIYNASSHEEAEELRDKRLRVVVEEGDEEHTIREMLSGKLQPLMEAFLKNIEVIGQLDLLLAKGYFSKRYSLAKPHINNKGIIGAGNLINLQVKDTVEAAGQDYTPIDIQLKGGTTIITGANMGGKTVALKTITLNVFLFQMGFFPMGEDVSMPLFDFIDFISDDMQDVSKGLSTFGAEMMKLKEIMIFLHRGQGFIALDEFARGTNPYEGQKIAKSLGEYLQGFNTISLMATHYDGVVNSSMSHYQVIGLRDVDFDSLKRKIDLNRRDSIGILQKYMDYRLERCEGYEAPKDALNITMLLGVHEEFTRHILKNYKGEV